MLVDDPDGIAEALVNMHQGFLIPYGIGIRNVAQRTKISKKRLAKLFEGATLPTKEEIARLSLAFNYYAERYKIGKKKSSS